MRPRDRFQKSVAADSTLNELAAIDPKFQPLAAECRNARIVIDELANGSPPLPRAQTRSSGWKIRSRYRRWPTEEKYGGSG